MKLLKAVCVYISITAFAFFLLIGCSKVGVLINGGGTDDCMKAALDRQMRVYKAGGR